jgi:hypothetical protein
MNTILTSIVIFGFSLVMAQPTLGIALDSLVGMAYQDHWTFETEGIGFADPTGTVNQYYNYGGVDFDLTGPVRAWNTASEASKHSYFPDATMCYTQDELSLERFFGLDADSNFVTVGAYYHDEGKDVFEFLDDREIISLPSATFGSTFRDTIEARLIVDGDTTLYQNINEKSMVSYGTVRTPEGIYGNCLIEEVRELDSIGNIHRLCYNFFHDNLHQRVLNVTLKTFPSDEILYMVYRSPEKPVSVLDTERRLENVYFSDHQLIIQTQSDKKLSLTMFDVSGTVIFQKTESLVRGINQMPIQTTLIPGYYFILVIDSDGNFYVERVFVAY